MSGNEYMLLKLLELQQQWATKKVLAVFVIVYFIFPLYLLPQILPEGRPLDLYLYYSPAEAFQLIESYGAENRAAYIFGSATIDMLYPLCYATFLGLTFTFLLARLPNVSGNTEYIRLFPYTILLVDVFENIAIISLLKMYPEKNHILAYTASALTLTKWMLFLITAMMLVYFLMRFYQKDKV